MSMEGSKERAVDPMRVAALLGIALATMGLIAAISLGLAPLLGVQPATVGSVLVGAALLVLGALDSRPLPKPPPPTYFFPQDLSAPEPTEDEIAALGPQREAVLAFFARLQTLAPEAWERATNPPESPAASLLRGRRRSRALDRAVEAMERTGRQDTAGAALMKLTRRATTAAAIPPSDVASTVQVFKAALALATRDALPDADFRALYAAFEPAVPAASLPAPGDAPRIEG